MTAPLTPLVGEADSRQLAEVLVEVLGALAGQADGVEFHHAQSARYWQQRLAAGPDREELTRLRSLLVIEAADPHLDRQLRTAAACWANELAGRLRRR